METVGSTKISATETQGMKFYYKGNLLKCAEKPHFFLHQFNFMMRRDDFTSLQRIDFIMQRIVAKRLSTT